MRTFFTLIKKKKLQKSKGFTVIYIRKKCEQKSKIKNNSCTVKDKCKTVRAMFLKVKKNDVTHKTLMLQWALCANLICVYTYT